MNAFLANMYDTDGFAEKRAQVEENVAIFLKAAEAEGLDLSELDDDEIVELAQEFAEDDGDDEFYGYDEDYIEGPDNIGPKTAEADFLGRVMAHAMYQEQEKIAKSGGFIEGVKQFGRNVMGRGKDVAKQKGLIEGGKSIQAAGKRGMEAAGKGSVMGKSKRELRGLARTSTDPKQKREAFKALRDLKGKGGKQRMNAAMTDAKQKVQMGKAQTGKAKKELGKIEGEVSKARKQLAGGALGAAALGGGAYAATKKSHIELIDDAALDRAEALVIMADDGWDMDFDKVASMDVDDMDRVITELAFNKLEEAGYIN